MEMTTEVTANDGATWLYCRNILDSSYLFSEATCGVFFFLFSSYGWYINTMQDVCENNPFGISCSLHAQIPVGVSFSRFLSSEPFIKFFVRVLAQDRHNETAFERTPTSDLQWQWC